jgi:transcriptional regulator with XRE-family HTH domain
MYAIEHMSGLTFRHDRLQQLMDKRGLNDGQLAYKADISKSMVYYLRTGGRDNVSATIAGILAKELGTSVEYLVGMTDDPAPIKQQLEQEIEALLQAARQLPRYRQRDLRRLAETFANENIQDQMEMALDMIRHYGGERIEDSLVDFLRSLRPDDSMPPRLTGESHHGGESAQDD